VGTHAGVAHTSSGRRARALRRARAGAPEAMRPVEALLEVAAFPDDGIAAMSFNFWHRLGRHLTTGFAPQSLDAASASEVTGPAGDRPPRVCASVRPRRRVLHSAACRAQVLRSAGLQILLATPSADAQLDGRRAEALTAPGRSAPAGPAASGRASSDAVGAPPAGPCSAPATALLSRRLRRARRGAAQATGSEEGRRRLAVFVPAFERLVTLVRGRVRLPDDWDLLHSDEQKDFKRGRFAVGDTLLDAASARPAAVRPAAAWRKGIACMNHAVLRACFSASLTQRHPEIVLTSTYADVVTQSAAPCHRSKRSNVARPHRTQQQRSSRRPAACRACTAEPSAP